MTFLRIYNDLTILAWSLLVNSHFAQNAQVPKNLGVGENFWPCSEDFSSLGVSKQ